MFYSLSVRNVNFGPGGALPGNGLLGTTVLTIMGSPFQAFFVSLINHKNGRGTKWILEIKRTRSK